MFKNILVPVSSEFYSKEVLDRSIFLAEKFKSTINLVYIIEEKTLNQTDKLTHDYRTHFERSETKKEIIRKHIHTADNIIFKDAKFFFKNRGIRLEEKIIEESSWKAVEGLKPVSDNNASAEYKQAMARILTKRVITLALARAKEERM